MSHRQTKVCGIIALQDQICDPFTFVLHSECESISERILTHSDSHNSYFYRCHYGACPAFPHSCGTKLACGHSCSSAACHDTRTPPTAPFRIPPAPISPAFAAVRPDVVILKGDVGGLAPAHKVRDNARCPLRLWACEIWEVVIILHVDIYYEIRAKEIPNCCH